MIFCRAWAILCGRLCLVFLCNCRAASAFDDLLQDKIDMVDLYRKWFADLSDVTDVPRVMCLFKRRFAFEFELLTMV